MNNALKYIATALIGLSSLGYPAIIPTFDKIKFNVNEGEQTIEFRIQY